MKLSTGTGFSRLGGILENFVGSDKGLSKALGDCEFSMGLATEAGFGVPAHAADDVVFMGDSAHLGDKQISAAAEAMLKQHQDKVQIKPMFDAQRQKWDMKFCMAGDEGFDPLAAQVLSPWNITYLNKVWKEPLAYSRAKEMVRTEHAGNNPFAEFFTLFLEEYAGWGVIGQTGSLQNNMTNDVNVKNGMLSAPIINMMGTYTLTLEEQKRKSWGALGSSPLARKQSYLNYVMDMMDSILIYFGNQETNTMGLLDINPIRVWDTGKSMKDIFFSNTSTTRGSDAFRIIAGKINEFLTDADNKFSHIKIAVSPEAYNYLTSMPYSDAYDATTAMETFAKSYLAGKGPNGSTPTIEWVAEPLLKANSLVNPNPFDYMVISAPEIGGGPEDEKQATNFYATALNKFVFPVIPGMYNHQYKTLRRVAGIIAPIPAATRVYAGFGVQE
jgi:hypothetical protein